MKRILMLSLLLTLVLLAATGCKTDPGEAEVAQIIIAGNGECVFTVVRPDITDSITPIAGVNLCARIEELCSIRPQFVTDWEDEVPSEILIGDTTRDASAGGWIAPSTCKLEYRDGKLIIRGGSPVMTVYAVELLMHDYCSEGVLSVPENLSRTVRIPSTAVVMPTSFGAIKGAVIADDASYINYTNGCMKFGELHCEELNNAAFDREQNALVLSVPDVSKVAYYKADGDSVAAEVNTFFNKSFTADEIREKIAAAYTRQTGLGIGLGVPDGNGIVLYTLQDGRKTACVSLNGGNSGCNSQLNTQSTLILFNPNKNEAYAVYGNMIADGTLTYLPRSDPKMNEYGARYQLFDRGYAYSEQDHITSAVFYGRNYIEEALYLPDAVGSGAAVGYSDRATELGNRVITDFYTKAPGGGYANETLVNPYPADGWGYGTTVVMLHQMLAADPDNAELKELYINSVDGLSNGRYPAYSNFTSAYGVVSYDDMIWFMRMWLDAYEVTGYDKYLQYGKRAAQFLIDEAWIEELKCFYWCDESPIIAPVSNAPLAGEFIRLYLILDRDPEYEWLLEYAKYAYDWTINTALAADGAYWNFHVATYKDGNYLKGAEVGINPVPSCHKFIYLNGCVIESAVYYYELTGDETYLDFAVESMRAAHDYFAVEYEFDGKKYYTYRSGNYNFEQDILLRSWMKLAEYRREDVLPYMQIYADALDFSYSHFYRDGYIPPNYLSGWSGIDSRDERIMLLDVTAPPTAYAIISRFFAPQS